MDIQRFIKHKLFQNVVIYTSTNAVNNAIPFLLLPVLTRYLTPESYGIVATAQTIVGILLVLVGLNLRGVVNVNFFTMDKDAYRVYVFNVLLIISVCFGIILGLALILKTQFASLVMFPADWLIVLVVIAYCMNVFNIMLSLWQAEQKALSYGAFLLAQSIFNIGCSLFFVIMLKWQWQGRLLGMLISAGVFGLVGVVVMYARNYLKISLNTAYIKEAMFFGLPLIPHALGTTFIAGIDRFFINSMVGLNATGIYLAGYQIGLALNMLGFSFGLAWVPYLFESLKNQGDIMKIKIVKLSYLYGISIIILGLLLLVLGPYAIKLFVGPEYQGSAAYVRWFVLGSVAHCLYYMVGGYILFVKKTYILAWITLATAGAHAALNYFLIGRNGVAGAAQATAITYTIYFILVWVLSNKVYPMPWLYFFQRRPGRV